MLKEAQGCTKDNACPGIDIPGGHIYDDMMIWLSDSLIVNLEVLFATLIEKLFWGFQWSRGFMSWPNKAMNTKFCVRTFLGALSNQNCWNCQQLIFQLLHSALTLLKVHLRPIVKSVTKSTCTKDKSSFDEKKALFDKKKKLDKIVLERSARWSCSLFCVLCTVGEVAWA